MSSLASLQRLLQSHIVDGDQTLAAEIESTDAIPAATRLSIYSDAYRLRLIEALQANYPILDRFMGTDEFVRLTQLYLSSNPSRHFSIRWFGHRLAEFMRDYAEYRQHPWLAELAEWEWKVATAFDASDAELLTLDDLAGLAPDEWPSLYLTLQPSAQRIGVVTNAPVIAKAAGSEQALPHGALCDERVEWLIWRRDLEVQFRSLDGVEACALDCIRNGATFEAMCEKMAEVVDSDEVPLRAVQYLRAWIDEQLLEK
jgi:hypothetical protein